jgi:hypothetical protein
MNSTPDPTRDALDTAVLAHPDEDTPHLVVSPASARFRELNLRAPLAIESNR